jgi:hypothetical protein
VNFAADVTTWPLVTFDSNGVRELRNQDLISDHLGGGPNN